MKKVIAIFLPIFYVATLCSQNNINYYEYWFDSDYDNKTEISISPLPQFTLNENIPTTGLTNGLHTFHIRFKDESAKYSSVLSQFFYKSSGGGPGAANISEYEYWFDNNYAEKILETIAPTPNFQLIENLENDLPIGLHTIHMRFKDSGGLWSSAVSQFFYKSNESGAGTISAYEYWFDENYADKIYEEIPPQEIFQINDDISADVTNGLHTLHIRFKDTGGLWSSSISHFFYKAGEGVGEINLIKAYRYWFNDLDSLITTIDLPVSVSPYFLVTEVNATALDTGYHVVNFQFQDTRNLWSGVVTDTFYNVGEPELNSISPAIGGNIGDVTVNIYGNGFFENTTVMLINPGVDTVYVPDSLMAIFDSKRIQATFDLREKTLGFYDMVVEVPEVDTVMTLVDGFEILGGVPAQPWVSVLGFPTIRINQWQTYTITYGNVGNIDARGVPLFLAIPEDAEINLGFNYYPYDTVTMDYDSIFEYVIVDSLFSDVYSGKIYGLFVGNIPPNSTNTLTFEIKFNSTENYDIKIWMGKPFYGSPFKYSVGECIDNTMNLVIGEIPVVNCIYGLLDVGFTPWVDLALGGVEEFTWGYVGNLTVNFADAICDCAAGNCGLVLKAIFGGYEILETIDACEITINPDEVINQNVNVVGSFDPNDKLGPQGFGLTKSLNDNQPFTYLIRFENDSAATALAQTVRVLDSLDGAVFDYSTFELGYMSFGDTIVNIPSNQQHFDTYVDLRPELNIVVKLEANFDDISGVAEWKYIALDPNNYLPVVDPLAGFLPPNIIAPEGEGSVFYTIHVKDSLENGVEISNKAYIYFDYNEPIITNEWTNALDNENPVSEVNDLPEFTANDLFMVSWSGADGGSQIENYDIYYSINGGDYLPWLLNTSELSADFFGVYDSTYAFYSIAKDSAGNLESIPASPDAITTIINCGGFAVDLNFTNDTVICEGTDLDLIASDGDSYIWSNGETTSVITISEPGEYYVSVSLDGICIATSDTINVSISPIPEIPLIIVDGEIIFCEGDSVTLISTAIFGNNWNTGDTTNSIVIYEEGIYTVEITNQCGASISDPISIIVHSNPLAIISNDGELEFCIGEDVVLTASEGEYYLWNNGENTESIVVSESDTIFVTITDINGCMATSDSVAVIAHQLPEIPIITNANDTLYTVEGYTYQWFFEGVILPGATNYYFVATEEGNYKVIITDINECIASSTDFYFNFIAIENAYDLIESLSIFPNPNDGKYTLVFNSGCNSELLISIYDAVGRIILEDVGKIENNLFSKNYDLAGYAKGSYLVMVVCDEGAHYVKVIAQ
ncbi:MAG: T9SS type A sorting domain-containing protein [Chitinophagales bacterium]